MGLVYSVSVPLPVRNPLMLPELIGWSLGFQCLLCGAWGLGIILTLEFFGRCVLHPGHSTPRTHVYIDAIFVASTKHPWGHAMP